MFSRALIVFAVAASALANVYTTNPVASTTFTGGQEVTISWQDDGSAPSLKDFGAAKVSIYAGNAQQQTSLQTIVPSVDVSTTSSIKFTPDPSIGPNSNEYFIRFESLNLKDAKQPQYPALAFSAKFTLNGMKGQFTPAVQAQIDGQSTAPLAGQTSAPASASTGSSTGSPATTTKASATSTGSKAAASSTSTSKTNGAISSKAGWMGIVLSAIVGAAAF